MHDLIAYSMSQTALRAQRAAADTDYPDAARSEFAALEVTAADASTSCASCCAPCGGPLPNSPWTSPRPRDSGTWSRISGPRCAP